MKPEPVETLICSVCEQPWAEHVMRAKDLVYNDEDEYPTVVIREVELQDCIVLLKIANQGPPGPVGPMGMPGESR
jgi:hypothetical protein